MTKILEKHASIIIGALFIIISYLAFVPLVGYDSPLTNLLHLENSGLVGVNIEIFFVGFLIATITLIGVKLTNFSLNTFRSKNQSSYTLAVISILILVLTLTILSVFAIKTIVSRPMF